MCYCYGILFLLLLLFLLVFLAFLIGLLLLHFLVNKNIIILFCIWITITFPLFIPHIDKDAFIQHNFIQLSNTDLWVRADCLYPLFWNNYRIIDIFIFIINIIIVIITTTNQPTRLLWQQSHQLIHSHTNLINNLITQLTIHFNKLYWLNKNIRNQLTHVQPYNSLPLFIIRLLKRLG